MERPSIVKAYRQKSDGTVAAMFPKPIRQQFNIVGGTRFMVYAHEGTIVFHPIDPPEKPTKDKDSKSEASE